MHYLCFKDFANWTHRTLKRKHWIDNARLISGCGVIKNSSIEYWGTRIEWIMKISREKNILYRRNPYPLLPTIAMFCAIRQCDWLCFALLILALLTYSADLFLKTVCVFVFNVFHCKYWSETYEKHSMEICYVLPWSTEHVLSKLCFIIVQLLRNLLLHQPGLSHHLAAQREILCDRKVGRLNPKFARPQRTMTKTQR